MAKAKNVELTPAAREDLAAIVRYLLQQNGPDVADAVRAWIMRDIDRLKNQSGVFPQVETGAVLGVVRKAPVWVWRGNRRRRRTSWVIYYGVEGDRVTVFRVRHSRQRWFWEED